LVSIHLQTKISIDFTPDQSIPEPRILLILLDVQESYSEACQPLAYK